MGGIAAVMLVIAALLVLLWPGSVWWVEHVDGVKLHGKDALTGAARQEALDKARGRITAVATGLLAAVAIYYTASNASSARQTARAAQESVQAVLRSAEHTEQAQRRTHELTERGQLTDRFTAAVAQLGDSNPAIQLGGVHALAGIADDAPRTLRQTCIDVLCAYLRLPYAPDPGPMPASDNDAERDAHNQKRIAYRGLREVRHTIIRLIRNHLRLHNEDPHSWQGHDFDFTDVVFDGGNLSGAHFTGGIAAFSNATFVHDFSFRGAVFANGWVDFGHATFSRGLVDFGRSQFSSGMVDFESTKYIGGQVDFAGSEFSGCTVAFESAAFTDGWVDLGEATFSGGEVSFGAATFTGGQILFRAATFSGSRVDFGSAAFTDGLVDFQLAAFTGGRVDFEAAAFTGSEVDFRHATFSGGRVNFAAPQAWDRPPTGIVAGADRRLPTGVSLPEPS